MLFGIRFVIEAEFKLNRLVLERINNPKVLYNSRPFHRG
jgi:hypothetical protein